MSSPYGELFLTLDTLDLQNTQNANLNKWTIGDALT